jgi:type III restriction enzyme
MGTVAAADRDSRKVFQPAETGLPNLMRIIARARARGVQIGIVIDEAHIAVAKETEFGKFCKALQPDRVLLASATPRDAKLNAFVGASGYSEYTTFSVGRDDVVDAGLNKRYIEAHVFKVQNAWTGITDIKRTAIREAWRQNQYLKERMRVQGISTVPLMLVQIENGASADEVIKFLTNECNVPPTVIGQHTNDQPDPKLMASIANDTTFEVLIFKESAGTGFDAPRSFILVSMKNVIDASYATQFLGRIMRVERAVRARLLEDKVNFDPVLDTGYLYLANIDAQVGFEKAVAALQIMTTEADGLVESLRQYTSKDGSIVYTNRPAGRQVGLPLNLGAPGKLRYIDPKVTSESDDPLTGTFVGSFLFAELPEPPPPPTRAKKVKMLDRTFADEKAVCEAAKAAGLRIYPIRRQTPHFEAMLKTEVRPALDDLAAVAKTIASRLNFSPDAVSTAVKIALRGTQAVERITELTKHETSEREVRGVFDPNVTLREASKILRGLPQMEDADRLAFLTTLGSRLEPEVDRVLEIFDESSRPTGPVRVTLIRNVTNLMVRSMAIEIEELYHRTMADAVKSVDAKPLPDGIMFPVAVPLLQASRNLYGVFPPSVTDGKQMNQQMLPEERRLLESSIYLSVEMKSVSSYNIAYVDSTWWSNTEEDRFARSLDSADFVYWWHRNPPRKPFSVGVVRADAGGNFFPDFVVCLATFWGDAARVRLIETKDSIKDAVRKMQRAPRDYGKVIFITKDVGRYRMVNDDGQLGAVVDDDLESLRDELRQTS